jgi:chromodomain-helicase-DNA-binding protein 7
MNKVAQLKLGPNSYFNPNYLLPDRILTSTEVFSAIHHKRANDVKGKWEESLLLVCEKLLNLVKDGYPYGVIFH